MELETKAIQFAKRIGLSDEQIERLLEQVRREVPNMTPERAMANVEMLAIQIKGENQVAYDRGMTRILEQLIATNDAQGLTVLIPGLSLEQAEKIIAEDQADYEERMRRQQDGNNVVGDLEEAHGKRIMDLLSGNFGGPKL